MKRILLIVTILFAAVCANAQRVTFWYGINCGRENCYDQAPLCYNLPNGPNYSSSRYSPPWSGNLGMKVRTTNFGIDYTSHLSGDFDWTVGIGLNEKGSLYRVNYFQTEGSAQYNFLKKNSWTIAGFAGLFGAVRTTNSEDLSGGIYSFLFGVQCGANVSYKRFSVKVGYEQSLTNMGAGYEAQTKNYELFVRLGVSLFCK